MVVLITFELRDRRARPGWSPSASPYLVLEPAMDKLTTQSYFSNLADTSVAREPRGHGGRSSARVSVPVAVELGDARLNVGDLLRSPRATSSPWPSRPAPTPPCASARRHAFSAQPGVRGRRAAVQITGTIDDSERTYA